MMRKTMKSWNLKKHFVLVTSFYGMISVVYGIFQWKKEYQKKKMTKKKLGIFASVIGICYIVDMISFPLVRKMQRRI